MTTPWTYPVRLHTLDKGVATYLLAPTEAERVWIAKTLGLASLPALSAELTLNPWMDGVEITGRFKAVVEQICAVSLDPFEHPLRGDIALRALPPGSPLAEAPDRGEVEYDLGSPDPPDVLEGDTLDLAAYVIEHLGLEIDPFARKPGVAFDYTADPEPESPFAALKKLQGPKG